VHFPADEIAENLPRSHGVHCSALAPLYLPAGQELHATDPTALSNLPAPHASQYVIAIRLCCLPAWHCTHEWDSGSGW
jgi:hypothetical protein